MERAYSEERPGAPPSDRDAKRPRQDLDGEGLHAFPTLAVDEEPSPSAEFESRSGHPRHLEVGMG